MKNSKKGRGIFKLFFLLSVLAGIFVSFFPLFEVRFPGAAEKINGFRGYYTGPLFITPVDQQGKNYFTEQFKGLKGTLEEEQIYYFTPAANVKILFSAWMTPFDSLVQLNLYKTDDMKTVIATNLNVPFAEGRHNAAPSYKGEARPAHANSFSYKYTKGTHYALKVLSEKSEDIGKTFVLRADASDGWISLPGLWAVFEVILVILLIVVLLTRFRNRER